MPDEDRDQRTERATPRWREEQRRKGRVAKSREINSSALMLFGALLLYFTAMSVYRGISGMMNGAFGDAIVCNWSNAATLSHFSGVIVHAAKTFAPVFLGLALVAAASAYGQVGFVFATDSLGPNINKLNPISGFKRIVSVKALFRLGTSLAKIAIVGTTIYLYLSRKIDEFPLLAEMTAGRLLIYIAESMFMVVLLTALVLIVLAAIDYGWQRYQNEKDLRMTPQQVKDELKRSEGDPLVKARVRQIQREMARSRMMQDVPDADVIVRNPTHFAVALKYDAKTMNAPKVTAKGANKIAERIIAIAEEHGVPAVENMKLARELYRTVDVGHEIPGKLYRAVAEVLAYVYQLRGRKVAG